MLDSASVAFRLAGPELIAAIVVALRQYKQQPFGAPAYTIGATEAALAFVADNEALTLTGPQHVQTLITGRGPTKNGNSGGEKLAVVLARWAETKGLTLKRGQTYEQVGKTLAYFIHKEGTALFKTKQPSGIIQSVLTKEWLTTLQARIAAGEMVAISTALTHAIQGK